MLRNHIRENKAIGLRQPSIQIRVWNHVASVRKYLLRNRGTLRAASSDNLWILAKTILSCELCAGVCSGEFICDPQRNAQIIVIPRYPLMLMNEVLVRSNAASVLPRRGLRRLLVAIEGGAARRAVTDTPR